MFLLQVVLLGFAAVSSSKIKVIYNNDNGAGCDPDNAQCLVHFLYYANEMDIVSIVGSGSTNCASKKGTNIDEIDQILDLYDKDYEKLNKYDSNNPYPTADALRKISIQGVNNSNPSQGYTDMTKASQAIIDIVDSLSDNEYVWYVAGAGLSELATALHYKPSIQSKIKLYAIGSWNTAQDPYSRSYIFQNFKDLWFIESNVTFRGIYVGGDQSGNYSDTNFIEYKVKPSGNLGNYYYSRKSDMKEGDAPSFLYVVDPDHANRNYSDATLPSWGGQYKIYFKDTMPLYYGDISSDENTAAQSVNKWRDNYLNDWEKRLQMLYT